MKKKTSLLISSMLVLSLLFAGTACSSDHRNTGSDTQNTQSVEAGLFSQSDAPTSEAEASETMLSGDAAVSDKAADASDMDAAVSDKVADASDMVEAVDVVDPGMVPVHPDDLFEGLYPVKMRSSSSMFKADHVCLEVKDGHMQAYLFMSSQSYLYMFPGTAMDAANAEEGTSEKTIHSVSNNARNLFFLINYPFCRRTTDFYIRLRGARCEAGFPFDCVLCRP